MAPSLPKEGKPTNSRGSGILLHITSLPSSCGIGDLGPEAYRFVDFLAETSQKFWQILPLNPTEPVHQHSPYASNSAFALNPLLVSPETLVRDGLLEPGMFPQECQRRMVQTNHGAFAGRRVVPGRAGKG